MAAQPQAEGADRAVRAHRVSMWLKIVLGFAVGEILLLAYIGWNIHRAPLVDEHERRLPTADGIEDMVAEWSGS